MLPVVKAHKVVKPVKQMMFNEELNVWFISDTIRTNTVTSFPAYYFMFDGTGCPQAKEDHPPYFIPFYKN